MIKKLLTVFILVSQISCSNNINNKTLATTNNFSKENMVLTELEKDKKGINYIIIFYSFKDKTMGDGEEINIAFTKENDREIISKITKIHRLDTSIENIDIKDKKKIKDILDDIKKIETSNDEDKENISIAIKYK